MIVVSVPLASNATLYQRLGDWVPVTAFAICGGAVGLRGIVGTTSLAVTHCVR